jgi:hypothetical protein
MKSSLGTTSGAPRAKSFFNYSEIWRWKMIIDDRAFERARRYVAKIPSAISGQNGHNQTFAVARALVDKFHLELPEARILLEEYNRRCEPPWKPSDLEHKLRDAMNQAGKEAAKVLESFSVRENVADSNAATPADPIPAITEWLQGFRCAAAELTAASPISIPPDHRAGAMLLLEKLYQPGELVSFLTDYEVEDSKAKARGFGLIHERDKLITWVRVCGVPKGRAGVWLRMNPVRRGISDANVTAFRFTLVEFDHVPLDLQLALLTKLRLPISAIITSGGRSVHAWVRLDAPNIEDYRATVAKLHRLLANFGVDRNNKNPSRMSRFPGARRILGASGDGRQELLYLNPHPEPKEIL